MKSTFYLVLITWGTLYAPAELTRVIIMNAFVKNLYPHMSDLIFIAEMLMLWISYIASMFLVGLILKSKGVKL